MSAEESVMSAAAKKRARQKANKLAAAQEAEAPAPEVKATPTEAPKAKAKPKAKADSKAVASAGSKEVGFSSCSVDRVDSDEFDDYLEELLESFPLKDTERASLSKQILEIPSTPITIEKAWKDGSNWVSVCVMIRVAKDGKKLAVAHSCNSKTFQKEPDAKADLQSLKNVTTSEFETRDKKEMPAPPPEKKKKDVEPKKAVEEVKVAEPKAKPKGKAKAAPKDAPKKEEEPPAPVQAKAKPKPDAKKAAAKPKAKPAKQEEEEPVTKKEELINYIIDDGSGGAWEEASGLSAKAQKQKKRKDEEKKLQDEMKKQGVAKSSAMNMAGQVIPGMMPPEVLAAQMKGGKTAAKANQSVAAVAVTAAAVDDKGKAPEKPSVESFTATVKIPDNKIGWVIGPKGATIALIKEKTGVKTIDTQGGVCTIIGGKDDVAQAEHAVQQLIEKGHCALQYDNYEEAFVMVHPQHFHQIIGEKGAIIQAIKKEAKCEVTMPETAPKTADSKSSKKYKVIVAGSKNAVETGKDIINSIVQWGYHPMTHPDFTHQEVEVEEWKYKYLIGTKGSEMRHIQNSFKVKVNIPRAGSETQNVVVVGDSIGVDRAVKYIEKVMWNADNPKGRGSADQAVDGWGDEEPEEDWMKAYMYKRK